MSYRPVIVAFAIAIGGGVACQSPTAPEACVLTSTPSDIAACMTAPGELSVTVTATPPCRWTATAGSSWISVSARASGTAANGVVRFTITDNWEAPRTGNVKIRHARAGTPADVRISQGGCHYFTSRDTFSFDRTGGSNSFDVLQQSDPVSCGGPTQNACRWSAIAESVWITVTSSMPAQGDQRVAFTVAPNATGLTRNGTITVRDQVVRITQGG